MITQQDVDEALAKWHTSLEKKRPASESDKLAGEYYKLKDLLAVQTKEGESN